MKVDNDIFTEEAGSSAIGSSKISKAIGSDGIAPIMLKHIGPKAIKYIADLIKFVNVNYGHP